MARNAFDKVDENHAQVQAVLTKVKDRVDRLMNAPDAQHSPEYFHQKLGKILWESCGMSREKTKLEQSIDEIAKLKEEFWQNLWVEMNSWESANMRPNEKKVYEAIKTIFSNADKLEIFNKKAIYLYLREITGLNTKQIVAQLNKMRVKYKSFKNYWEEGNI